MLKNITKGEADFVNRILNLNHVIWARHEGSLLETHVRLSFHFADAVGYVEKKSDDTKFYIAIGATILFFFVGIAIGVLAFKRYHSRHCCSKASVAHNDGKNLFYRLKACYERMFRKV